MCRIHLSGFLALVLVPRKSEHRGSRVGTILSAERASLPAKAHILYHLDEDPCTQRSGCQYRRGQNVRETFRYDIGVSTAEYQQIPIREESWTGRTMYITKACKVSTLVVRSRLALERAVSVPI